MQLAAHRLENALHRLSTGLSDDIIRPTAAEMRRGVDLFLYSDRAGWRIIHNYPDLHSPISGSVLPDNPAELNAMWSRLSRAEKDELHRQDPFVGNRDGIPHIDRDLYNRQTMAMLRALANASSDHRAVAGYDRIAERLHQPQGSPQRYLAVIEEPFRSVTCVGNPDKAQNIITFVVGAGRGPMEGLEKPEKLRQATMHVDPTAETSVIRWSGYLGPPDVVRAIDPRYAEHGAPLLRRFQEGLRVTHEGPPSLNTVIGYSYGSVTAGHAMLGSGLDASQAIFVGSFGVGAKNIGDLRLIGVDPLDMDQSVFKTVAKHDSIQLMPKVHGPMPTSSGFGGTDFASDSVRGPSTSLGFNPDNHQSYFDSGNQSLRNMGLISAGYSHLAT
ncbi:alpha/beta hydrolase [Nocardia sp. NPDC051463]|uniref:alpha/beta hydrolase n=1 Tax=Nocardia sp. NPDC051463 TaxID=3154845 RepID=UPI00344E6496